MLLPCHAKAQDIHRAARNTCGTPYALDIIHRTPLARIAHHVNPHVTNPGADVATDTLGFVGKNPIARKAGVDVHERRQRTAIPAPDATGIKKVNPKGDRAGKPHVNHQLIPVPEVLNGYRQGQSTKGGRPKPGPGRRPVGQPPTQRKHENNQQYPLPQMFPTLGPLAMGSQRAIVITEGFSQRTARANPATIGPLAKKYTSPGMSTNVWMTETTSQKALGSPVNTL